MYKFSKNLLPPVFINYFQLTSNIHSHSTRQTESYRGVYARTNSRLFSLRCMGLSVWNNSPVNLRHLPSLHIFKKSIRTILLNDQLLGAFVVS